MALPAVRNRLSGLLYLLQAMYNIQSRKKFEPWEKLSWLFKKIAVGQTLQIITTVFSGKLSKREELKKKIRNYNSLCNKIDSLKN